MMVSRRRRAASAAVFVLFLLMLGSSSAGAAPPSNDDFADAIVLAPGGGSLTADNTEATKEVDEPDHAGDAGGHSVWYSWTPNFSGVASIDTVGSSFDTLLSAYTGGSVSGLTDIANDDDVDGSASVSRICFAVTAGALTTVIAVDGYNGDTGSITLNWGQKTDSAPCPMLPPSISGPARPKVGDQLFLAAGNFVDGGGSEVIAWSRCVEAICDAIPGADSGAYTVSPDDVGAAIRVDEEITNAGGTAHGTSDPTGVVAMTATTHPNGRIFWVTSRDGSPGDFDIHSMFPDGSSPQQLTSATGFATEPAVSPDGKLVAFVDFDAGSELKLMTADGSTVVDLGVQGTYPAWSPNGARIAYATGLGIGVVGDFGNVTLIPLPFGSTSGRLAWSPDGTTIAFAYRFPGHTDYDIATVAADGRGAITELTTSPVDDHDPAWSPTGDRIAFDRGPVAGSITDGDLFAMDANGSNETLLVDGDASHVVTFGVDWSPDGSTILFSRFDNGNTDLFTIPASGGVSPTQLTTDGNRDEIAAWGSLASYDLSVSTAGSGSGTVTGGSGAIACGSTCSASFVDASSVSLTATAAVGSTFTGWSGACSGTGPCIVSLLGDRDVIAEFAVQSSAGGGGGGGSASVPNLGVSIIAKSTQLAPGDVDEFTIYIKNAGGAGSLQTDLKIQLPGSMTLLSPPYFERGSGCKGATLIDCFLDYIPNGDTTKVIFDVRANAAGAQTITATATDDRDSNPADNMAALTVQVAGAQVILPPPVLKRLGARTLLGVAKGRSESVAARFSANESLRLTMSVHRLGSTRRLMLLKGTRLAAATAASARLVLSATASQAGSYPLRVLVARSRLVKGATYVIAITAGNADGKTTTLRIRFRA
jgi:hypothetical protein